MEFLKQVAQDIAREYDGDFSNLNVLFPNKRAITFFNEALYDSLQRPFFSPNYFTISQWVNKYSRLVVGDELTLLYNLYIVYTEVFYRENPLESGQERESFDNFYYWGMMLLQDFDDVDKNLANVDSLFRNIKEYKEVEDRFDFLTQEQKKVLERFFVGCTSLSPTELNKRFVAIWNCLKEIYQKFKERLQEQGVGYTGMIYRLVCEELINKKEDASDKTNYCIIGFNVLNKVEKNIFSWIRDNYNTRFYWDIDDYYIKDKRQEAGLFMRENIFSFPHPKGYEPDLNKIKDNRQELQIISSPGENAQVGYIKQWIENLEETDKELKQQDIAIILGNESLLPSVLSALPHNVAQNKIRVNITMGYPFKLTSLFSLFDAYLSYQASLFKSSTPRLIKLLAFIEHPYIETIDGDLVQELKDKRITFLSKEDVSKFKLKSFIEPKKDPISLLESLKELVKIVAQTNDVNNENKQQRLGVESVLSEMLYRGMNSLNRLTDLFCANDTIELKQRLVHQTILSELRSIKIPFEGDPINGVQVMGLLESRNLDFKHVLVLSANDDCFPNVSSENSFIPFSIRRTYDLTTIERKIAVFAYYFYRLFHFSKTIHFLYNCLATTTKKKEMTRFLQQIRIESNKEFIYKSLRSKVSLPKSNDIDIAKEPKHIESILNRNKKYPFSASYLNVFLNCPMRFFLAKISKLESQELYDEELTALDFGNVFHKSAQDFYNRIIEAKSNSLITKDDIVSNKDSVEGIVRRRFEQEYLNKGNREVELQYNQLQQIQLEVIKQYVEKLLILDENYAPFTIVAMEMDIEKELVLGDKHLRLCGQIDRVDLKDGVLRVVDYKTNDSRKDDTTFEALFADNAQDNSVLRNDYVFQTFFYSWLLHNNIEMAYESIKPEILYIKRVNSKDFTTDIYLKQSSDDNKGVLLVEDYCVYDEEFESGLSNMFERLFTVGGSYEKRKSEDNCKYCLYREFCY